MNIPGTPKPFGPTNELAKERNRAAAERTLNSWVGNCFALMGWGVAFDRISEGVQRRFPDASLAITAKATQFIGMTFVGAGIVLLAIALIQHRLEIKSIERDDYVLLSVFVLNRIAGAAVLLLGASVFFTILFLP